MVKIRIGIVLFGLILVIISCTTNRYLFPKNICEDRSILYCANKNDFINQSLQDNGIEKLIFINSGAHVDTNRDGLFDIEPFTKFLNGLNYNRNAEIKFVLDWESQFKNIYGNAKTDQTFNKAVKEIEKVLKTAKKIYPSSKWGIYNIPIGSYWKRDKMWEKDNMEMLDLLSKFDLLFPSLYDYYRDDNKYAGGKRDSLYIEENLDLVFNINKIIKKRIYVFVWHRWHNSNSERPLEAIDLGEFRRHPNIILNFTKNNRKVDGIVWWASDQYFLNAKSKSLVREAKAYSSDEEYLNNIYIDYMNILVSSLNESCNN